MKRSKSETRTNYLLMFADMWGQKKPFHLRDMINQYKVNANVGGALVAAGYIGKTYQHGYYQWKASQPTSHDVDVVINEINKTKSVKPTRPKQYRKVAYNLVIKCKDLAERGECAKLLDEIGIKSRDGWNKNMNSEKDIYVCVYNNYQYDHEYNNKYTFHNHDCNDYNTYQLDHFDAKLISDIVSVSVGDVWVKGEPFIGQKYNSTSIGGISESAGKKIKDTSFRRPTIAEICNHYGYKLDGLNILKEPVVKFVEAVKTAYPHKGENITTEQREQAAIDILGEIMRDNQHITYDLIRIEKHETKTDLLKL